MKKWTVQDLRAAYEGVLVRQGCKQARAHLKKLGWTYRTAAPLLGVHYTHLAMVLTENPKRQRASRRLLTAIATMQPRRAA